MEDNKPSLYSIKSVCQLEEDEFEAVFEFDSDSDTPIGLRFNRLTSSFLIQQKLSSFSENDLLTLELLKNENLLVIEEDVDEDEG